MGIVIIGYESSESPLEPALEAFEVLAGHRFKLSPCCLLLAICRPSRPSASAYEAGHAVCLVAGEVADKEVVAGLVEGNGGEAGLVGGE